MRCRISGIVWGMRCLYVLISGFCCSVLVVVLFQAHLAEENGCVALIIYSDPADYAPKGGPPVFPNGTSLPPSGVQRGSLLRAFGDPLTPGIPAIPGVHRINYEDVLDEGGAPSIPVQPLSYEDAIHFMRWVSLPHSLCDTHSQYTLHTDRTWLHALWRTHATVCSVY